MESPNALATWWIDPGQMVGNAWPDVKDLNQYLSHAEALQTAFLRGELVEVK